jgi:hypothetical protein
MFDFVWCRQTRLKSMTTQRQALCSREALATSVFLTLILVFFFVLPSILVAQPEAGQAGQPYPVLPIPVVPKPEASPLASLKAPDANQRFAMLALALVSAVTLIAWRYHRRDYASPRRIGRRI